MCYSKRTKGFYYLRYDKISLFNYNDPNAQFNMFSLLKKAYSGTFYLRTYERPTNLLG